MLKHLVWIAFFSCLIVSLAFLFPESAFGAGVFESKMERLRDSLTGTLLPLASTIALVYAAILAVMGSGEGKARVVMVIAMSIVGLLAKPIIEFFQGIAG